MAKKPRYAAVVRAGGFDVTSPLVRERLREKGYQIGDDVAIEIYKVRNIKFNNLVHKFGELLAQNLDDFDGMEAHAVLKRLQLESGVACDEIQLRGDFGLVYHRQAQSLSFDNMDDGEFSEVFRGLSRHVSKRYWTSLTPEQIEQMAGFMPDTP